jgi:hypothetical protein
MDLRLSFVTPLVVVHQQAVEPLRAVFTFTTGGLSATGENMSSQMQAGTRATVSVAWKDATGNVVSVESGTVNWASSDPETVECVVSTGNPLIANLFAPGPIGKVTIQATGDADLGQGVKTVTASYDVEVISGEAVGGEITFSQSPAQGGPDTAPTPHSGSAKPTPRR